MVKKKILIAETSMEFSESLCDILRSEYDLWVCHNGLSVTELMEKVYPDVLVMDLALPGIDGVSLLKQIATLMYKPRILVTTCFMSPYIESAIANAGVDMVALKPCQVRLLTDRIQDLVEGEDADVRLRLRPRSSIGGMLMELDLPAKRRGFIYLEQAIKMHMEEPTLALTKVIYPEIAREHDANSEAVERAIRQLIHESWERRDERVWKMYFGSGRQGIVPRPTNAEFISRIAECYRHVQEGMA